MRLALITEGASEHRVIKHFISKYLRDCDPTINQIQPKIINNTQANTGGWNEVLNYCSRPEINDILIENDILIIQIDTDQSQIAPYSVNHLNTNGTTKTVTELYNDVKTKLESLIVDEIKNLHKGKIIFAICIHSIECWLLPLYYTDNRKTHTNNCLDLLNRQLRTHNIHVITQANKNKPNGIKSYDSILRNIRRKDDLTRFSEHNTSFKNFVDDLDKLMPH